MAKAGGLRSILVGMSAVAGLLFLALVLAVLWPRDG
jgi:hypothetical protein